MTHHHTSQHAGVVNKHVGAYINKQVEFKMSFRFFLLDLISNYYVKKRHPLEGNFSNLHMNSRMLSLLRLKSTCFPRITVQDNEMVMLYQLLDGELFIMI